jgi:glc operon protein GlcG
MVRALLVAAALVAVVAVPARAQVLEKKVLTLEGARRAIAAAEAEARRNKAGGIIAVVDDGGNLMALERLEGTFAAGARVSIGKARTAALFKKPTRFFEELINKGRTAMTAVEDFTPLIGGVPIVIEGQIVGAIGVSGANSAQQDEEVALAGAAAVTSAGPTASIAYFRGAEVAEAFVKGRPLLEVANYKVHASHRDGAGKAEVHLRDTDIIHVLHGKATLVTGGTVLDGQSIEADEIRGSGLQGGDVRHLAEGDVVVVPSGVPHWFQQASAPFDYYVVKVR